MANIIGLRCRFGSKRGWLLWGFFHPQSVCWLDHDTGFGDPITCIPPKRAADRGHTDQSLPVLVGIMIGLLAIISLTALSENFEPPLPPAPGLDDDERDAMLSILTNHMGGGEE